MSNIETIKQLIPLLSNKELAELNYLCWVEATERAAVETEREMQLLVDNALKK